MKRLYRALGAITSIALLLGYTFSPVAMADQADGKLLFSTNRDGNTEIYSMNLDGSGQTNLTNNPGSDTMAQWSRDGTKIFFISDRNATDIDSVHKRTQIFSMNADGSDVQQLTNDGHAHSTIQVSPDGTKLLSMYVHKDGDSSFMTTFMDTDGTDRVELSDPSINIDNAGVSWSPDSKKILISRLIVTFSPSYDELDHQVVSYDIPSATTNILKDGIDDFYASPVYSPDMSKVATNYLSIPGGFFGNPEGSQTILLGTQLSVLDNENGASLLGGNNIAPFTGAPWHKLGWFGDSSKVLLTGIPKDATEQNPSGFDLYTVNTSSGEAVNLTHDLNGSAATSFNYGYWQNTNLGSSTNGKIIFNSTNSGGYGMTGDVEIYSMNSDGTEKVNLTNNSATDIYQDFGGTNTVEELKPPKTGRLATAILITVSILATVLLLARAYKRKYHNSSTGERT